MLSALPRVFLLLALLAVATAATAATLTGKVVSVHDGDTITVLDASRKQHKVRLAGIDAPELKQPYGHRAKENLSKWVYGKEVIVEWNKTDRYGRIVGVVLIHGHDVNLEQIRAGMAWWYRQYANEQRPDERRLYEFAETEARSMRRGFWADSTSEPPWNWRHK